MYRFIILLGIVSFFADITYEGARSILGPFMALLGASGAVVGTVAGLGEFIGYGVRLVSGMVTDKTRQYWMITFVGYASNLIAVPLLALANNWQIAALLIILERIGKAIRTPARDAMLSYACKNIGRGWGFGIHQAMDRFGALIGPIIVYSVLSHAQNYRLSFILLGIPAVLALGALAYARRTNPAPQTEESSKLSFSTKGFSKPFWLFLAASGLIAAGYVDYALIAYHFQKQSILPAAWIPLMYMFAMASAALFSLIGGKLFDFFSKPVVIIATAAGALSTPLFFTVRFSGVLSGMILWGIGLGMQGSVMRSIVANLVEPVRRSTAYGTFGLIFGLCWFIGSSFLGWLYDHSLIMTILVSMVFQLCAIPFFLKIDINAQTSSL